MDAAHNLTMHTLMDTTRGRYRIHTLSGSTYEVDFDQMWLSRRRGSDHDRASGLRRDEGQIRLVQVIESTVGHEAVFIVDLDIPGVTHTVRRTTLVVSIEPAPDV